MIDENTIKTLEFGKILEMASSYALTWAGKAKLLSLRPLPNHGDMLHSQEHVSEWRLLMAEDKLSGNASINKHGGIEEFDDLTPLFARLRPAHSVLDPLELRQFIALFNSALNLKKLVTETSYPIVNQRVSSLFTHKSLKRSIDDSIESDGHIADKASPELASIRKKLVSYEKRIRHTLEKFLDYKDLQPHIQDNFLTERKGRWVIPIKKDSRGHLPGVVHDISNTGETLFVEPFETQHMGNEMESLKAEEKMEEYKVLKKLAAMAREHLDEIETDYNVTVILDSFIALAKFSESMNMNSPEINLSKRIKIIDGCHPILWRSLAKQGRDAALSASLSASLIPLNFELGGENLNMVITGSNAGGKTVTLKTIGVIHLMALSGMHVPAKSGTSIPYIEKLFVDIGDDQSIEENLSTFSAHVSRIASILNRSGEDTLVLLDELGTGTDPEEGGSLACAILRYLSQKGALSVITTHLRQVKVFAYTEKGTCIGTMDMEILDREGKKVFHPTYRLVMGEFGQSYAFEIATHYGLPADLIHEARHFLTESDARLETLVTSLRQKITEINDNLNEVKQIKDEALGARDTLRAELSNMHKEKDDIIMHAYKEAEAIISVLKSEAREILESMKKADIQKARETVVNIDRKMAAIMEKKKSLERDQASILRKLVEGQRVVIRGYTVEGVVLSVKDKRDRCTVLINGREVEVPVTEVMQCKDEPGKGAAKTQKRKVDSVTGGGVSLELNIVGQRVDPALSIVERYLNDVAMEEIKSVKIIHGLGTGTLSRAVREFLSTHPLVQSFRKGSKEEGGEAVTIVLL